MKIKTVDYEAITFEDGSRITYDHYLECCENNFADFEQLDDIARAYDFQGELLFEKKEDGTGFYFGDSRSMFYVPCYSDQNGYYTNEVNIYYKGEMVIEGIEAEERLFL